VTRRNEYLSLEPWAVQKSAGYNFLTGKKAAHDPSGGTATAVLNAKKAAIGRLLNELAGSDGFYADFIGQGMWLVLWKQYDFAGADFDCWLTFDGKNQPTFRDNVITDHLRRLF
jgi:hypothetical protein